MAESETTGSDASDRLLALMRELERVVRGDL